MLAEIGKVLVEINGPLGNQFEFPPNRKFAQ